MIKTVLCLPEVRISAQASETMAEKQYMQKKKKQNMMYISKTKRYGYAPERVGM